MTMGYGVFSRLNAGYNYCFTAGKLTVGLISPIEAFPVRGVPALNRHLERVQLAEALGFSAVWLRDVPFTVPSFGDVGQTFDPWVYLGYLAARTSRIALATGSIILPIRHPAHVAKAAATVDQLSGGRLILGIASGDRPEEYPATNYDYASRAERFRETVDYIRSMARSYPNHESTLGSLSGTMDMVPKPVAGRLPLVITGSACQSTDWAVQNTDGMLTYPRSIQAQAAFVEDWQSQAVSQCGSAKPVAQSLYVDLTDQKGQEAEPIHLGFRSGVDYLIRYLRAIRDVGVNHVGINLRFNREDTERTMKRLATEVLPAIGD